MTRRIYSQTKLPLQGVMVVCVSKARRDASGSSELPLRGDLHSQLMVRPVG